MDKHILGIDIGGSGIKGAIVDITTGDFKTDRLKIDTPKPATPKAVADTLKKMVDQLDYKGRIGCGFPAIMKHGVACSASNIDKSWIGTNAEQVFSDATDCKVFVANDADVAGLAEHKLGYAADTKGTAILLTLGTGIGSALIYNGELVPNTELGHVIFKHGEIAELYAANSVREKEGLSWKEYGHRLNEFLHHLDFLFSPDLFIIGGGISKVFDNYEPYFDLETKVVPSKFQNKSGIIGAAIYAHKHDL
jgi:polyphosphate glucokinase